MSTPELRHEPKQTRSEATLEKILTAAEDIVDEVGERRITTKMVAERIGMSIGTFYRYFTDVVALLEALDARFAERVAANALPSAEIDPGVKLRSIDYIKMIDLALSSDRERLAGANGYYFGYLAGRETERAEEKEREDDRARAIRASLADESKFYETHDWNEEATGE